MCSNGPTQTADSIDITGVIRTNPVDCIHGDTPLCVTILDKRGAEWVLSSSRLVDQLWKVEANVRDGIDANQAEHELFQTGLTNGH